MEQFVLNTRHWPRVAARFRALLVSHQDHWRAQTEDLGPGGCQLVSPRVLSANSEVRLAIAAPGLTEKLAVAGRIAWMSQADSFHLGVAFTKKRVQSVDPRTWFVRLLQTDTALAKTWQRIPQHLSTDTWLFLGDPSDSAAELTRSKLAVLQLIGNGTRIADVLCRHPLGAEEARRAIFSLLAGRRITLSLADAVPPQPWDKVLSQAKAAWAPKRPSGSGELPPPLPTATHPDSNSERPLGAQTYFLEAKAKFTADDLDSALALACQAYLLAPHDPEISALLRQLAFTNKETATHH